MGHGLLEIRYVDLPPKGTVYRSNQSMLIEPRPRQQSVYATVVDPETVEIADVKIKDDTIAVVIPACNEGEQIASTVRSLMRQTRPPDRILVVVNNSTDNTAARAREAGAEVIIMTRNPHMKAGALNVGVLHLIRDGACPEVIVTIDGDTDLEEHCVERAFNVLRRNKDVGGLGAVCMGKRKIGETRWQRFLTWLQRLEYARAGYVRIRRNVHTLPGAGSFLRGEAVLQILRERGVLFKQHETNLVEDFELTLELKRLGWKCVNNYYCVAFTDLMPTIPQLLKQRTRWVRGTVDELRRRGWRRETRGSILTMSYGLLTLPIYYAWPALMVYHVMQGGLHIYDFWVLPFVATYQALAVKRMGLLAMLASSILVFDITFALLRHYWFVKSIVQAFAGRKSEVDWKKE